MENMYFSAWSGLYSTAYGGDRFVVLDQAERLVEDAQGYGLRSEDKANACVAYKRKSQARTKSGEPLELQAKPEVMLRKLQSVNPDMAESVSQMLQDGNPKSWAELERRAIGIGYYQLIL